MLGVQVHVLDSKNSCVGEFEFWGRFHVAYLAAKKVYLALR